MIRPAGEWLAKRAQVVAGGDEYSVHVGPFEFDGLWCCTGLDLASSFAIDGSISEILETWELVPVGRSAKQRSVRLSTGEDVRLWKEDLGKAISAELKRIALDPDLSETERKGLRGGLKLWGNAAAFGLPARMDEKTMDQPVEVHIVEPGDGSLRTIVSDRLEVPARWTFLPMAAMITACSRFLSIRLQARVERMGGVCVSTMFDAVTILASPEGGVNDTVVGGPFKELSFAQVRALLEEDDVYLGIDLDAELPLWRAEAESLDKPTFAYPIGTNKVPLLQWEDGWLRVVRGCDANVGSLVDPSGTGDRLPDGHYRWTAEAIEAQATAALADNGRTRPPPDYSDCVDTPVSYELRITTRAQWWRLHRLFPEAELRPWDRYFRIETHDRQPIYSLDGQGWRSVDGKPARPVLDDPLSRQIYPDDRVSVRSVRDYLDHWHGLWSDNPLLRGTADPFRGLRSPMPIRSDPCFVELCGRDMVLWDVKENDPDAETKDAILSYGPAVPPTCLFCEQPAVPGRGTTGKRCEDHLYRHDQPLEPVRRVQRAVFDDPLDP